MKKEVICRDWYENEKYIWGVTNDSNLLFKIDKSTRLVKILDDDLSKENVSGLFARVFSNGRQIVFAPYMSDYILIYYINENIEKRIYFDEAHLDGVIPYNFEKNFWEIIPSEDGNSILILGYKYPAVIRLDLNSFETTYVASWMSKIPEKCKKIIDDNAAYFGDGFVKDDGNYYVPSGIGGGVWKISNDFEEIEYIDLNVDVLGFHSISRYGEEVLLTELSLESNHIFVWDPNNNKTRRIELPEKHYWNRPIVLDKSIYLFSWMPNGYVFILKDDVAERCREIENVLWFDEECEEEANAKKMDRDFAVSLRKVDRLLQFISFNGGAWCVYDTVNNIGHRVFYRFDDDDYNNQNARMTFSSATIEKRIMEECEISLNDYLMNVVKL